MKMKKNLICEILLGVLALIVIAGFIVEIIMANSYAAPWYVIFWSILTPVIALYFILNKLIALIKKDKGEKTENPNNPTAKSGCELPRFRQSLGKHSAFRIRRGVEPRHFFYCSCCLILKNYCYLNKKYVKK